MPAFTVKETLPSGKPWHNKAGQGPFTPYRFRVEGLDDIIEWSRKEGSPGPKTGDVITGELIDNGSYGKKFRKAQQEGGRGGGWQPPSPEEIAAMRRSGAGNRAIDAMRLSHDMGLLEGKVTDRDSFLTVLSFFIDFFDGDVAEAAARAKQ